MDILKYKLTTADLAKLPKKARTPELVDAVLQRFGMQLARNKSGKLLTTGVVRIVDGQLLRDKDGAIYRFLTGKTQAISVAHSFGERFHSKPLNIEAVEKHNAELDRLTNWTVDSFIAAQRQSIWSAVRDIEAGRNVNPAEYGLSESAVAELRQVYEAGKSGKLYDEQPTPGADFQFTGV